VILVEFRPHAYNAEKCSVVGVLYKNELFRAHGPFWAGYLPTAEAVLAIELSRLENGGGMARTGPHITGVWFEP
jgi:hypothetical protein